jgi:hypothetical protein
MPDTGGDQPSRFGRYDERIEELVGAFSDQVERVGGKALDELAATAKRLAQRLEDVAEQARLKREKENAGPEPGGHSESAAPEIDEPSTNE